MNKTITSLILGAVTISSIATTSPVFAKNDNNNGKGNSKNNSPVTFIKSSDDDDDKSRIKILTNNNITKIQTVGPSRLKNNLELKFKWHEGSDDLKIKVPKGTMTTSSQAFVEAVKTAYTQYKSSVSQARQTFLLAVATARATYITSSTTSTINTAPVILSVTANPSPVVGNTTTLSAVATDNSGEPSLIYNWSLVSSPASSTNPTFGNTNNVNSAKNMLATFYSAGSYTFRITATDGNLLATSSTISVTVNQTLSAVNVTPASTTVAIGSSTQFTASAFDQFNLPQPSTFFWSIFEGVLGGNISSTGLYTAPTTTGTYHVIGTTGSKSATSTVTVQ